MSPSFHFNWLGGAGVVSKDIDPKPFYESLTSIMTNAYRFAKAGKNISGTGPATGVLHLISVFLTAFTDFINYFEVLSPCQFTSSSYYSQILFSLPLSCPLFSLSFHPSLPLPFFLSIYLSFFLSFFLSLLRFLQFLCICLHGYLYLSPSQPPALDLVEFTVKLLEDDPLFNAGAESSITVTVMIVMT